MKKVILLTAISIAFGSCAVSKYEYKLDLMKPIYSDELKYIDEKINVEFTLHENAIAFKILNNSEKPIKIIWDEASFVKNGEAQKILHKNVKYFDKEKTQPPTVVPAKAFIEDLLQPIDDIKLNTGRIGRITYANWSAKPIFPVSSSANKKRVLANLGSTINVYLPIQYEGKTLDYYFEMKVIDILLRTSKTKAKSIAKI